MTETSLLPCPFCGAAPSDIAVTQNFEQAKIVCLKCSAEFTLANHFRNEKQAVVNAWNIRAERTCHLETNCNTCSKCSECGYHVWHVYNYCPSCGAKVVDR